MSVNWFQIANKTEFEALDIPSKEYQVILQGIGLRNILVTKGNLLSVLYEGVFLSIGLNEQNPFAFDGHAVYLDDDENIWLGIEVAS